MNFLTHFQLNNSKKKENIWFEKYVQFKSKNSIFFFDKEIDIKKIEKKLISRYLKIKISLNFLRED